MFQHKSLKDNYCGDNSKQHIKDTRRQQDYLKLADTSPYLLLEGETPRLIDEWQMAPVLWDSVRSEVDERQLEGQFILTGSIVPKDNETMHSGTGRISTLMMQSMSLYESLESNGKISLADLLDQRINIDGIRSTMSIPDLAFAICRGGWPTSIGKSEKVALLIAKDYINSICESDAPRIDGVAKNPDRLRALLRSYARNISTNASNKTLLDDVQANDALMSEQTLYSYLNVLKRLLVIDEVPAWCPSIRSKTAMRYSNKKEFVDPSLGIAILGLTPKRLILDFNTFGFFFEAMCIRDLKVYAQALDGSVFYYHDRYGLEAAAKHLIELKELIIKNSIREPNILMILTGGEIAYTRADGVFVVPLTCCYYSPMNEENLK